MIIERYESLKQSDVDKAYNIVRIICAQFGYTIDPKTLSNSYVLKVIREYNAS